MTHPRREDYICVRWRALMSFSRAFRSRLLCVRTPCGSQREGETAPIPPSLHPSLHLEHDTSRSPSAMQITLKHQRLRISATHHLIGCEMNPRLNRHHRCESLSISRLPAAHYCTYKQSEPFIRPLHTSHHLTLTPHHRHS